MPYWWYGTKPLKIRIDPSFINQETKKGGLYEVSTLDYINSEVDVLFLKFYNFSIRAIARASTACEICGVNGHTPADFQMILTRWPDQDTINHANGYQWPPKYFL